MHTIESRSIISILFLLTTQTFNSNSTMDRDSILTNKGKIASRYAGKTKKYGVSWQKDGAAINCSNPNCAKPKFTFTNRKHHCRWCGQIFCGPCSKTKRVVPGSANKKRVCQGCNERGGPPLPARTRGESEVYDRDEEADLEEEQGETKSVDVDAPALPPVAEDAADAHENAADTAASAPVAVDAESSSRVEETAAPIEVAVAAAPVAAAAAAPPAPAMDETHAAEEEATEEAAATPVAATPVAVNAESSSPVEWVEKTAAAPIEVAVAADSVAAPPAPAMDDTNAAEEEEAAEAERIKAAKAAELQAASESKAAAEAAAVNKYVIPEDKSFDILRKAIVQNTKDMEAVGLGAIELQFDCSFANDEAYTSKDSKKRAPHPGQATTLTRLKAHMTNLASKGLAALSKKDDLVKEESLSRVKRIVVCVDLENSQNTSVGKHSWLTVSLNKETGDLTSVCNMDQVEVAAEGMKDKLFASFGDLTLKIAIRDAQVMLTKKALKTFKSKYGTDLPVEFNCLPFAASETFTAMSPAEQTMKIARIPLVIDSMLKGVVKCAKEDEFKTAFDKRVSKIIFTYDPTSSITYKARNSNNLTVKWKAELQGDASEAMILEITQNLNETRGGLDAVKEVLEPALGIGVDEAQLLADAKAANDARMAAIKASQTEARSDKKAAADERNAERVENERDARAADQAQRQENMAASKAESAERKAAHNTKMQERTDRQTAAGEANKARFEEQRAAEKAQTQA